MSNIHADRRNETTSAAFAGPAQAPDAGDVCSLHADTGEHPAGDGLLEWFGLDAHDPASSEAPDELACISLTTPDDPAGEPPHDESEARWM